jgi:ADP-heptose:LPS heptosyltransferase
MIGDVLASTVICDALKRDLPSCEIHYVIQKGTTPVIENHPHIDRVLLFEPSGLWSLINFGKSLKRERYDAVIDAYGKWESVIPSYLSNARKRIGFKKWYTKLLFTDVVTHEKGALGTAMIHRLQLVKALTGKNQELIYPKIYLTEAERAHAKLLLDQKTDSVKPIIMISVLGSDARKSLPADYMAQTLDVIAQEDVQMIFNFMPHQIKDADAIYALCHPDTQKKIILDLYTKGLRSFLAVLSHCDALIGNEGGAVNMAKALAIPTFTIFSPWIKKESWNMLTNTNKHVAVHLNDYFPDIYGEAHPKKLKNQSLELYLKLKPELYANQLRSFVRQICRIS